MTNNDNITSTPVEKKRKLREDPPDQEPKVTKDRVLQHHEKHYDENGDLEIVTSDSVLFKIHSYEMQAASVLFRNMMQDANASRISLIDDEFEDSKTLAMVLIILMYDGSIADLSLDVGLQVIKLAQKFELNRLISQLKMQLKCDLFVRGEKYRVLRFAIALQDYKLCSLAMERSALVGWADADVAGDAPTLKSGTSSAWIMNPASLPLTAFESIPREALWAWSRAYLKATDHRMGKPTKQEAQVLSKEFLRLMTPPEMETVSAKSNGPA